MFLLSQKILVSLVIFSSTVTVVQSMNPRTSRSQIKWHVKGKSGVTKLPDRATKNHQKKYQTAYQQLEDDFSTHKASSTSNSSQRADKLVDEVGITIKKAIRQKNTIFDIIETLSKEIDPIKNSTSFLFPTKHRHFLPDQTAAQLATERLETIYAEAIYRTCLINKKLAVKLPEQKNHRTFLQTSFEESTQEYSSDEFDQF